MPISGSLGRMTINNQDYPVANDADISRKTGIYTKESQATSGEPNIKFTRQNEDHEGFDLQLDGTERSVLRDVVNGIDPVEVVYQTARGDAYSCTGHVSITGDVTQDAKVTVMIMPSTQAGWSEILV